MYRRPKFLEVLISIREDMARQADYDADLFAELIRADLQPAKLRNYSVADTTEPVENGRRRVPASKTGRIAK